MLFAASAYSNTVTIPNTFSAGTPAKAAEVNANFNALANAINGLSAQINSQSQNSTSGSGCQLGANHLGLNYSPTNNLPNTNINGYRMAAFPLIDLINGSRYSITFPVEKSASTDAWDANLEVTRSSNSSAPQCGSNISINGFRAYLASNDGYNFNNVEYTRTNGASGKASASVTIFFGGSQVTLDLSVSKKYTAVKNWSYNFSSFTPTYAWNELNFVTNFPWNTITPLPSNLTSQLQTLINSISFRAVPWF